MRKKLGIMLMIATCAFSGCGVKDSAQSIKEQALNRLQEVTNKTMKTSETAEKTLQKETEVGAKDLDLAGEYVNGVLVSEKNSDIEEAIIEEILWETTDADTEETEYTVESGIARASMYKNTGYVKITNVGERTLDFKVEMQLSNEENRNRKNNEQIIYALEPGQSSFCTVQENKAEEDRQLQYEIKKRESVSDPALKNLEITHNEAKDSVYAEVNNIGETIIDNVEVLVLCFDANGKLVAGDTRYVDNFDSTIYPSGKASIATHWLGEFDHCEVYLRAESDGIQHTESLGKVEDVEVKSYFCEEEYSNQYYFVVKNLAQENSNIDIMATQYDAEGKIVDSSIMELMSMGPSETFVSHITAVEGAESVEYNVIKTKTKMESLYDEINVDVAEASEGLEVTIKDSGKVTIKCPYYYILCFDANDQLLEVKSEILAFHKQESFVKMKYPKGYDHAEVYVTAN